MDIHEGAEEERVTHGEDDDGAPLPQVGLEPVGAVVVERPERGVVAARVVGEAGRHRVAQLLLDHPGREQVGHDRAGHGLLAGAGVEGDDVGPADEFRGPKGHQSGVARVMPGPTPTPKSRPV